MRCEPFQAHSSTEYMTRRRRRRTRSDHHPAAAAGDRALPPVATLDLHGFTASEVPLALNTFFSSWRRRTKGTLVHVITGKGKGSAGRPVIRPRVRRLLSEEFVDLVASFEPDDTGGGFMVNLK